MFKKWLKERENKKKEILLKKFYEIRSYITNLFENLQLEKDTVEIPAWMECQNFMEKLNITKENEKAINYYYSLMQQSKI